MTPEPILLSSPDVGLTEQQYLVDAVKSGWVAPAGPDLEAFEAAVAERVDVPYAVGLSSGTAALHLALVSWGVGPGDVVPVSTLTFSATVNAIRYVGATPYFVDSEPESGNIDADLLSIVLDELRAQGKSVPAVIPVDLLGKVADYDRIQKVVENHGGLHVLSDAAEAFGSSRNGIQAGAHGEAAALSFNGNKIMTTSGGGMLLTHDAALAAHVRKLSTQAREPVAHYEHVEVGYNYRLSNILAALGRAQLSRLDAMIERRRGWRARYRALFADVPGVRILGDADDSEDNCWLTALVVDPGSCGWTARELGEALAAEAIETRPLWKPMHLQPVNQGFPTMANGVSESLFQNGLTLPSGSSITDAQFDRIEDCIHRWLAR